MSVCLLVIGDGRDDYYARSRDSASEMLPDFQARISVNDASHELGFAGAIERGWDYVLETGCRWVFHLEADFTFNAPVPVEQMIGVLERHPYLAQICLKRQPWNDEEKAAGGIVECNPDDFEERSEDGEVWTEHRRCFSTNPCIYPAALCHLGWPQESQSEGVFTHRLLEDPTTRFAFWGPKLAPPLVEHIGAERIGTGY